MSPAAPTVIGLRCRVAADRIAADGLQLVLRASEADRRALAGRLGLEAIASLEARLTLERWRDGHVVAAGALRANVTQLCVVTVEPVEAVVEADIQETFRPAADEQEGEVVIDIDSPDDAEPFTGGIIDVGALITDSLATAIDPYPRAEGAELDIPEDGPATEIAPAPASPFADLARLAPKRDGG